MPAIHERHATEQSESESGDETESSDGNERWWRRRTILDDGRRREDARVRAEGVRRDAAFREGREDDKGRVNSEKKKNVDATVLERIERRVLNHPRAKAIVEHDDPAASSRDDKEVSTTYGDLWEKSGRMAKALSREAYA